MSELSGYRVMWIMAMFDLPVGTKAERKAATRFRNGLLDEGFEMCQFSVYVRFCAGKEQAAGYARRIRSLLPITGSVQIFHFTDKQFANALRFEGKTPSLAKKKPDQLVLI